LSGCILITKTSLLKLVPKFELNAVSALPSGFNLVNLGILLPLKLVKSPPTNILPSGCNSIALTIPLKLVDNVEANVESILPSEFNLVK
jgi:hypothetical protein